MWNFTEESMPCGVFFCVVFLESAGEEGQGLSGHLSLLSLVMGHGPLIKALQSPFPVKNIASKTNWDAVRWVGKKQAP